MYIAKQKVKGKDYYYLRKSVREGKKVMSKNVAYLGKDKREAELKAKKIISQIKKEQKTGLEKGVNMLNEKKEEISSLEKKEISIDEMAVFCKRKGFVYPSGEIYGGLAGFFDYGHLGVELKNNIKQSWWNFHVRQREDIVGIDGSIITNPEIWKASGHVESFSDILVVCKKCKKQGKVDKNELGRVKCPNCGGDFESSNYKKIKLMFETNVGESGVAYLRPETAQLIFTNFKFVQENARMKLPFGIAQIGKSFRNEIAPRDFLFRCREFEQMEIEYFADPKEKCPYEIGNTEVLVYSAGMQEKNQDSQKMKFADAFKKGLIKSDWICYWLEEELLWFIKLGADSSKFRIRQHVSEEKAHYAIDTWDLEYQFPFGWKELQGLANRGDFDLRRHQEHSKTNLEILNDKNEKVLPHIVCEPSQGVERALLVFLFDAYFYDKKRENLVLKLHPKLAPVKIAVFPLVKRPEFEKIAQDIFNDLKKMCNAVYDKSGSIGRRYARNDEIGTLFCITIDEDSLKKKEVTVRIRDSAEQIRIKIKDLKESLRKAIDEGEDILKFGKVVDTRKK